MMMMPTKAMWRETVSDHAPEADAQRERDEEDERANDEDDEEELRRKETEEEDDDIHSDDLRSIAGLAC